MVELVVTEEKLNLLAKMFNGFSDLSRLKIINVLRENAENVSTITEETGLSQPNVSSHLKCLKECNLVTSEKHGRATYYSLASEGIIKLLDDAEHLLDTVYGSIASCINYEVEL